MSVERKGGAATVPPGGYRQAGCATQHRVLSVKTCWPYGARAYGDSTKAGLPAGGGTDTRCIDQVCVRPSIEGAVAL